MRYTNKIDWFELWELDKKCILNCMYRNLTADLNAGYNFLGNTIKIQKTIIAQYEADIEKTYDLFKTLSENEINRWCFYDLKKRGAIE